MSQSQKIGAFTRICLLVSGVVLLAGGANEIQATSQGNQYGNWSDESSFAALGIRAQGGLKLGLGIAMLGASGIGFGPEFGPELMDVQKWLSQLDHETTKFLTATLTSTESSVNDSKESFDIAVNLYKDCGGKSNPDYEMCEIRLKWIGLRNKDNEILATLTFQDGNWHMSHVYQ